MDDDDFLSDRLKRADMDDPADGDVDALIGSALRRGRRRVFARRVTGVVAVCAVLAVVAGFGITQLQNHPSQLGPAASPTAIPPRTTTPSPTMSPSTASSSPAPARLTRAEMERVVRGLIPRGLTVTEAVGGNPYDNDHSTTIYLTVQDNAGTAYLIIGLTPSAGTGTPTCDVSSCRSKKLQGGTLIYYPAGQDPDKAGEGSQFTLTRPDGTDVFFSERNSDDGNGPVTRTGLPLTDQQAESLVTDPVWDDLAPRCHPHTNNEDC